MHSDVFGCMGVHSDAFECVWTFLERLRNCQVSGPVFLGKEGLVRDQRVVELGFAPRRSADGSLEVFERVVVELHFSGGGRSQGGKRRDRWGEAFLQETLVNYEQARKWRRPRMRRAARPALQDDGAQLLRVWVREKGIYRVTGADLEAAGLSLTGVDPTHLRMSYGGGEPLTEESGRAPVVRKEIGIVVEEGGDGRFDAEDFVLFYGEAASRWEYDTREKEFIYLHNLYTHENAYWLEVGGGGCARSWRCAAAVCRSRSRSARRATECGCTRSRSSLSRRRPTPSSRGTNGTGRTFAAMRAISPA